MSVRTSWRGQPALVLLALVAGWIAVRVALWQSPFPAESEAAAALPLAGQRVVAPLVNPGPAPVPARPDAAPPARVVAPPVEAREPLRLAPVEPVPAPEPGPESAPPPGWALAAEPPPAAEPALSPRLAAGHTLLLAAAFSAFEMPPQLAALVMRARAKPAPVAPFPMLAASELAPAASRWSGDGWLLLRQDTTTPITSGRGSYGRSQLGAVLRYRLAEAGGHRPAAYLRASTALSGPREVEAALGLSGRPLAGLPVALAAELRAARTGEHTEVRPAAFAYSEFPPLKLPLGVRGEAYFQGGYAGGRFATGFVDGQVRIEREVARLGPAELRAGAGAWGGVQKGARRLDIGPGASVAVELGGAPLRMSADWRFRVAGEANPSSGPAVTVSAGF